MLASPHAGDFSYYLNIFSVSPYYGSVVGGTDLEILGSNFSPELKQN
jgi:hypothetical protein